MICLYPVALAVSTYLSGLKSSLTLIGLGAWYNDLGGAESYVIRNTINVTLGLLFYSFIYTLD